MTYVYAGAADWGGKDPAKCNRGLYRLATDTGTWTTIERGEPRLPNQRRPGRKVRKETRPRSNRCPKRRPLPQTRF